MNGREHIQPRRRSSVFVPIRAAAIIGIGLVAFQSAFSPAAVAHTENRPVPETLWTTWNFDPVLAIVLLLVSLLYLKGTAELWRRAGKGRGVRTWQPMAFFGGVITFTISRFSPLDALGGALFSAHMGQHLIVFLLSPALFAASRPLLPFIWALPTTWRRILMQWTPGSTTRAVWFFSQHWITVLILYAAVLWLWHVPVLYDWALQSQVVHGIEHATFAAVAFMFWSRILESGRPNGIGHGIALLMTFATALHSGALGALLTFARFPLYSSHEQYTSAWGYTPLEDQQLAGVLMWVPMGIWFAATGLLLFGNWIRAADRSVRRWETGDGNTLAPESNSYQRDRADA